MDDTPRSAPHTTVHGARYRRARLWCESLLASPANASVGRATDLRRPPTAIPLPTQGRYALHKALREGYIAVFSFTTGARASHKRTRAVISTAAAAAIAAAV